MLTALPFFFFLNFIDLFYFWLCWAFIAVGAFSCCGERGLSCACLGFSFLGFSCCGAQVGMRASGITAPSSVVLARAPEPGLGPVTPAQWLGHGLQSLV